MKAYNTELKDEVSPRVAKLLIEIRDYIVQYGDTHDSEEIYHILYKITSPRFDKLHDDVWKELEEIAKRWTP